MFGLFYDFCPVCNKWHDDGGMYTFNHTKFYLCIDCLDNITDGKEEEINKILADKITKN